MERANMKKNDDLVNVFINEIREISSSTDSLLNVLENDPTNIYSLETISDNIYTMKGMFAARELTGLTTLCQVAEEASKKLISSGFIDSDSMDIFHSFNKKINETLAFISTLNLNQFSIDENKKLEEMKEFDLSIIINDLKGITEGTIRIGVTYDVFVEFDDKIKSKSKNALQILDSLESIAKIVSSTPTRKELRSGVGFNYLSIILISNEDEKLLMDEVNKISGVSDTKIKIILDEGKEKVKPEVGSKLSSSFQSVRISLPYLNKLMDLVGELVIVRNHLEQELLKSEDNTYSFRDFDNIISDLQNIILSTRLVPLEQIFNYYPRIVREGSKESGKSIDLVISGKNVEIDRISIDAINESIIHLIRNAIDHGIETPEIRKKHKKPEKGRITIKARKEIQDIVITVEDDGEGIDISSIRKIAEEKKLIKKNEKIDDKKLLSLLFHSGFSTKEEVSQLSGRGIGLNIAYNNIVNKLKGKIDIEPNKGLGTKFIIRVKMDYLIVNALVVKAEGTLFTIPFPNIKKVLEVSDDELEYLNNELIYNLKEYQFNDTEPYITESEKKVSVISLGDQYKLDSMPKKDFSFYSKQKIVIWEQEDNIIGILIDEILTRQEIVYKKMDEVMNNIKGFRGLTFVGDGDMVPVFDPFQIKGVN
jgi:two-component system chemotaxis sensor kinase CheA